MAFDVYKPLQQFRRVQTRWGDTLQRLAQRELDDATRWVEIAAINDLAPPYLTGDEAVAGLRVLLYGQTLLVPVSGGSSRPVATSAEDVFYRDVSLSGGRLSVADGDIALVAGRANLRQALSIRVQTEPGELVFHGAYGCRVHEQKGRKNAPVAALVGAAFVREAVQSDERIDRVTAASATPDGDVLRIRVEAQTVTGHPVDVQAEI